MRKSHQCRLHSVRNKVRPIHLSIILLTSSNETTSHHYIEIRGERLQKPTQKKDHGKEHDGLFSSHRFCSWVTQVKLKR